MPLQRVLNDREAEPGAAGRARPARVDAVEALRDPRDLLLGDADTRVDYVEHRAVVLGLPGDLYGARRRREPHGVVHEVVEDRVQLGFVAEQRRVRRERELDGRPVTPNLELVHDELQHPADVDELVRRLAHGGLEPGELDQVAQDPSHPVGLAPHLPHRRPPRLRHLVVVAESIEVAADHGERRAQLVRRVRDEVAARTLELNLTRDVAHDREALVLAVRDDLHREPARLLPRRRNHDALARRRAEVSDEIRMSQQVVEPVADIGCRIEPEQPRRGRIEPQDLVIGIQDDAAVAERAGALAHLAQQPVIFLLAVARLRAHFVDARENLGPKPARLEQRHAPVPVEHAIEQP